MGDPGVPVMMALLAVPVGVFLLVLALTLAGGRWDAPVAVEDSPALPQLEPPRPMLALPAAASSPALLPYRHGAAGTPPRTDDPWAPTPRRQPAPHYPYGRVRETEPPTEPEPRFPYGPYRPR